jgi:hypothetical protein
MWLKYFGHHKPPFRISTKASEPEYYTVEGYGRNTTKLPAAKNETLARNETGSTHSCIVFVPDDSIFACTQH